MKTKGLPLVAERIWEIDETLRHLQSPTKQELGCGGQFPYFRGCVETSSETVFAE
jgi:hypothetical protein